ncbi:MAG: hypothetical protein LBK82_03155 [Planctomycetaceae bacterium]|nr:hypothetical protein [Planctomycetaceae bacterium]
MTLLTVGNRIPKRKATQIAFVNLVHSRLTPTRPFSKRSPTSFRDFSVGDRSQKGRRSESRLGPWLRLTIRFSNDWQHNLLLLI